MCYNDFDEKCKILLRNLYKWIKIWYSTQVMKESCSDLRKCEDEKGEEYDNEIYL